MSTSQQDQARPATVPNDFDGRLERAASLVGQNNPQASSALLLLQAEAAAVGAHDDAAECAYLHARARLLQGELVAALDLIDEARSAWLQAGSTVKAERTNLGRMNVLDDLGRHGQAIEVGQGLLDRLGEWSPAEDEELTWLRAATLKNLGVSHGFSGRHQQALESYAAAERFYLEIGELDDMARSMANRGVEMLELGDAAGAIVLFDEAADSFSRQGDNLYLAKCLAYEARAQLALGNYLACAAATERAADVLGQQDTSTDFARVQLVRADTLRSLNMLDEALESYEELCSVFADEQLDHDRAASELGRAIVLARLERLSEARSAFDAAHRLYRQVGDHGAAAVTHILLSELLDDADARSLVDKAVADLESSARPAELAAALIRSSQLATDPRRALELLEQASTSLTSHDMPHLGWRHHHELGRRLRQVERQPEALDSFLKAIATIESMRVTIDRDLERLPFMAGRDVVIADTIALYLHLDQVDEAYALAESERSRTLVEVMSGQVSRASTGGHSHELDELYDELLHAAPAAVNEMDGGLEALESTIDTTTITAAPTHGLVNLGEGVVVTYQLLDDDVYAFVSDPAGLRVIRCPCNGRQLRVLQTQLEAQWRRFDDPGLAARHEGNLLTTVVAVLQDLHLALIAPLDVLDASSLMLVPHGAIANLPFAAFHDGTCHLIERMPVTMAPSLQAAKRAAARSHGRSEQRRLVLGVENADTPWTVAEAKAIGEYPGATALLGDDATVQNFWDLTPDHDIVHIAAHGIDRVDNPLFSAVQFADRWLTASEISGSTFDGQLVVLNTCSSGRQYGARTAAEIDGLPRAFLAAGAGAVLVNLWQVDDAASYRLMDRCHAHLSSTINAAQALRAAQQETMAVTPHPYYWASAVIIGAPSPTNSDPKDIA